MDKSTVLEITTPAKIHKTTSLPIAQNSGSGYEKAERARTSHACEPCRERKTKCDGERPSCHRCLHTGTGCHYGYGKGWRKRKVAEDLTVTSRKLQIYESLLSNIYPRVDSDVQSQIDEARNQDIPNHGTPDTVDSRSSTSAPTTMSSDHDHIMSTPSNRLPLPLPLVTTIAPHNRSGPPTSIAFDRVSGSTSPHLAHHPKREMSLEETGSGRLPSITPQGLLIENEARNSSPTFHHSTNSLPAARPGPFNSTVTSPRNDFSSRPGWSTNTFTQVQITDLRPSVFASSAVALTWNTSNQHIETGTPAVAEILSA